MLEKEEQAMYKTAIIVICMTLLLTHFTPAFGIEYGLGGLDVRVPAIWIEDNNESLGNYTIGPGEYGHTLDFGGIKRFYKIHVPSMYNQSTPMPVVLVFHGGGGYPDAIRYQSGMDQVSDNYGFIVVYPAGSPSDYQYTDRLLIWNDGRPYKGNYSTVDDVGFISAVLDDLSTWFNVDSNQIYACGISNGSLFAYRLANQLSDRIVAIAGVTGHRSPYEIFEPPPSPIPVMQFSGAMDAYALFNGGIQSNSNFGTSFQPVKDVIQSWVTFNFCSSRPVEYITIGKAIKISYGHCQDETEVVLWTLRDGGHTWPGGKSLPSEVNIGVGNINMDINASQLMWEFFRKFHFLGPGD
jgi:polyhydroxybutyrate depolymerase